MLIRVKRKEISILFMAILAWAVYMINMITVNMQQSKIRYVFCAFALAQGLVVLIAEKFLYNISGKKLELKGAELLITAIVISGVFLLVSFYKAYESEHLFSNKTVRELWYNVFPILYAYILLNLLSFKSIQRFFRFILITVICAYIYRKYTVIIDIDHWVNNWLGVLKFWDSGATQFEDSTYCGLICVLFSFFTYFRFSGETEKERKIANCYFWISFFMVIMVHKRLTTLYAVAILLIDYVVDFQGQVPRCISKITAVLIVIATVIYFHVLTGELLPEIDIFKFSMARSWILSLWARYNYLTYGLGSSVEIIGDNIEMDLIKIYLELGIIPLFIFVYGYLRLAHRNVFCYLLLLYQMLYMVFSASLYLWYDWAVVFLTVFTIHTQDRDMKKISRNKTKWKKLFKRKGMIVS